VRTTQRNTTYKNLCNKFLSHTHLARTCLVHTGIAFSLFDFEFQMSTHSWCLNCKCALFLFTFHIIVYCLHITDVCISRVHSCIVFALWMSVFESPCGGSANASALMVSVVQILTLRINWIYKPDVYNSSHTLILLYHMQCYYFLNDLRLHHHMHYSYFITCTAVNSSHVLLLLHHMQCYYLTTCTALTSSYARLLLHRLHFY